MCKPPIVKPSSKLLLLCSCSLAGQGCSPHALTLSHKRAEPASQPACLPAYLPVEALAVTHPYDTTYHRHPPPPPPQALPPPPHRRPLGWGLVHICHVVMLHNMSATRRLLLVLFLRRVYRHSFPQVVRCIPAEKEKKKNKHQRVSKRAKSLATRTHTVREGVKV